MDTRILSVENVVVTVDGNVVLRRFSFLLGRGEAALIRVQPGDAAIPFADLAQGLVEPAEGMVSFMGKDWTQYGPDEGAAARGTIRRVFPSGGWLSNLDVDENITLSERHHTVRPIAEIEEEAAKWAARFDLDGVPHLRPALMKRGDLRRAEWVRAFMGRPALILLEEPMKEVYTDHLSALLQAVHDAREQGAAVLWLTGESPESVDGLNPTCRWVVEKGSARAE